MLPLVRHTLRLTFAAGLTFGLPAVHAQHFDAQPAPVQPGQAPPPATQHAPAIASSTGCCGPITPAGAQLIHYLDSLNVDKLWQPHEYVNWLTGEHEISDGRHEPPTHCSAFAAAAATRLDIPLLHPPEHKQAQLAEGQREWLGSKAGADAGWVQVKSPQEAQELANQGEFVVLVFGHPHSHLSGHIAVVRPAVKTDKQLKKDGPETTQAGGHNFSDGTATYSFVFHPGVWPNEVDIFAHTTKFQTGSYAQAAPAE